jgi:hypothetical protein
LISDVAMRGLLQRMKAQKLIEGQGRGVYALPGSGAKPSEPRNFQIFRRVDAQDVSWSTLLAEFGTLAEAAVFKMRKRGVLAWPARKGRAADARYRAGWVGKSVETVAKQARGEAVLDGKDVPLWEPPIKPSDVVTLHSDRPHVDRVAKAQKLSWLRTLKGAQLKIAVAVTAKELGWDPMDAVAQLPRAAQRYLRKEAAREQFQEEVTPLMEKYPKRSPQPLRVLFKKSCERIDGLTREICDEVIDEREEALLREKGLKTSWREPGAPIRCG